MTVLSDLIIKSHAKVIEIRQQIGFGYTSHSLSVFIKQEN